MATVDATVRRFHTEITTTADNRVDLGRLVESTVPARGREWEELTGAWIVYASHWPNLRGALQRAGWDVKEGGPHG